MAEPWTGQVGSRALGLGFFVSSSLEVRNYPVVMLDVDSGILFLVFPSVMRCLGVPTRVVSNFRSAHNVDGNLTIDTYYDQNAEMLPTQKRDKIW